MAFSENLQFLRQQHAVTQEQLAEQVRVTVLHEVGHYFGLDEHDLHRLGYA